MSKYTIYVLQGSKPTAMKMSTFNKFPYFYGQLNKVYLIILSFISKQIDYYGQIVKEKEIKDKC